jgi:hypothetical protein
VGPRRRGSSRRDARSGRLALTDELLRRLADESELRDLIHRYAFGLDDRDWRLWRSVFADEVVIDMGDYRPEPPPRLATADQVVHSAQILFAVFEATQHFIGTHRFEIDGDEAVITAHMRAEHWLTTGRGGDRYTMYGTYTDDCIRTAGGWKITRVKLRLLREEGNRQVMRSALERGRAKLETGVSS